MASNDARLMAVVRAWDTLPEHIRQAIVTLASPET